METPNPDAPEPQTLAAGELVWAKTKGRHWWPARLRDACPMGSRAALVSCFGDADERRATQVRRFADPGADEMARTSRSLAFVVAVQEAQAHAVAVLHRGLTCACASHPGAPPPPETNGGIGEGNLAPSEFLASLHDAALDVSSVGLVDCARLKSWVLAVAQGWGPAGAGHYPRRSVDELVDKIDLDVPAGEDKDAADWVAGDEDKALQRPQETPMQKRRSVAALMEELDAGEDETKGESGAGLGLSAKRERKKSKYLSPPYTNLGGVVLVEKVADSPKELLPDAAQDENKVLLNNVGAKEVLLLLRGFGKDVFHKSRFPKAAKGFLGLFRCSVSVHGTDYDSYKVHSCPVENVFAKDGEEIAGLVSDPCVGSVLEQEKCALKRSRKKDQDGSVGSSIKRKKRQKTNPTATLGCGISITPAIPIRQVKAEDIRTQMKAGGGARVQYQKNTSLFKSPISVAMLGAIKLGRKQDQANGASVMKTPVNAGDTLSDQISKKSDDGTAEATKSEIDIQVDMNVQSVIVDVPVRNIQMEEIQLEAIVPAHTNVPSVLADLPFRAQMEEMQVEANILVDTNVQSVIADVKVRSFQMEAEQLEGTKIPVDTDEQSVSADVPVRNGSLPTLEDISQPADGSKDHANVEMSTVQESYASLEAMVPEMLKEVEVTNGLNVITASHALKDESLKGEQPNQKKIAVRASANHSPGEATNGTCPDPANSTHKKKKKKTAPLFENPAAILLEFTPGVVLPSKEELLSAFGKFGFLIESRTEVLKETRSAHVVFGKSAEAEVAYHAETLGIFGPPFATLKELRYLPPIELSMPPPSPAPKPPLANIRKNLENMISSLTGHSSLKKATSSDGPKPVSENLLGEMQGLLAKVDKVLTRPSTSTPP